MKAKHMRIRAGITAGVATVALIATGAAGFAAEGDGEVSTPELVNPHDDEAAAILDVLDAVPGQDVLADTAAATPEERGDEVLTVETSATDTTLPQDASEPIEMESQTGTEVSIELPYAETTEDATLIADGVVSYENDEFLTVPVVKDDGSVQINTIIESGEAPERYPYNLDLPDGAAVELTADGGVLLSTPEGEFLGALTPPWAKDADGNALATWYEVDGSEVTQVVKHRDADVAYPVVADPWLGIDLFSYTGYNRKGTYLGQVVVSTKMSAFGWTLYYTSPVSGDAILVNSGWSELVKKSPQADDKPSMRQQYMCHVAFGRAVWLAGLHWDLEKARPSNTNYLATALAHKCNW